MILNNYKLKRNKLFCIKKIILSFVFVSVLLLSWLWSYSHPFWEHIDRYFFLWVNSFIKTSYFWQNFWAISSHSFLDWIHDVVMILFFLSYIFKKDEKSKLYKFCEILFFAIIIAVSILIINRYIFTNLVHVNRKSPSLIYDSTTFLSEKVSWLKVKDRSTESFPGDHGTTAILFTLVIFHLKGVKSGLKALFYSFYWQLPRLVTGSHWLTDILMGSLTIAILIMSLCIYTPLKDLSASLIYFIFNRFRPIKKADVELGES